MESRSPSRETKVETCSCEGEKRVEEEGETGGGVETGEERRGRLEGGLEGAMMGKRERVQGSKSNLLEENKFKQKQLLHKK